MGNRKIKSNRYVQLTMGIQTDICIGVLEVKSMVSISTAIHEMGHIMGLLDSYNSSNVSQMYFMSVMTKHMSLVPQFMSLKEKEVLG